MNTSLILYYDKPNRYSFNALVGAIETDDYIRDFNITFVPNAEGINNAIENVLARFKKIVVGFSFATTQLWNTHSLIKKLRERDSRKILYIAGGPHPTGDPIGTLMMGFDIAVVGEGE